MIETEILVVGGGPAGVISAITAAKLGRKVILVDTKSHNEIGHKVCGDALNLSPVTFLEEKLGIQPPHGEEVADKIGWLIFSTPRVQFPLRGDEVVGFVVNRWPYGQRLLQIAEESGVEVRAETKAINAIISNNAIIGAVVKDTKTQKSYEIHAKITIDCSGSTFRIRKTIPAEFFQYVEKSVEKRDIAATYREIIHLKHSDHSYHNEIHLIYHDEIPEPGYFWIFSKGEKRLNVGIGWFMDTKTEIGMKELFTKMLHKYYPEGTYEVEEAGGGQIPTRYPLLNAIAPGFLAAGDAAVHVNPLSAEGHGPALIAGYYAGDVASKAIKANDFTEKLLWQYNVNIMKHFGLSHTKIQLFTEAIRAIKVDGIEFFIKRKILNQDQFLDLHAGRKIRFLETLKIAIKAFPRYKILYQLNKIAKGVRYFEELFSNYPNNFEDFPSWYLTFKKKMDEIQRI